MGEKQKRFWITCRGYRKGGRWNATIPVTKHLALQNARDYGGVVYECEVVREVRPAKVKRGR